MDEDLLDRPDRLDLLDPRDLTMPWNSVESVARTLRIAVEKSFMSTGSSVSSTNLCAVVSFFFAVLCRADLPVTDRCPEDASLCAAGFSSMLADVSTDITGATTPSRIVALETEVTCCSILAVVFSSLFPKERLARELCSDASPLELDSVRSLTEPLVISSALCMFSFVMFVSSASSVPKLFISLLSSIGEDTICANDSFFELLAVGMGSLVGVRHGKSPESTVRRVFFSDSDDKAICWGFFLLSACPLLTAVLSTLLLEGAFGDGSVSTSLTLSFILSRFFKKASGFIDGCSAAAGLLDRGAAGPPAVLFFFRNGLTGGQMAISFDSVSVAAALPGETAAAGVILADFSSSGTACAGASSSGGCSPPSSGW